MNQNPITALLAAARRLRAAKADKSGSTAATIERLQAVVAIEEAVDAIPTTFDGVAAGLALDAGGSVVGLQLGDGSTLDADAVVLCMGPWSQNAWLDEHRDWPRADWLET